MKTNDFVTIGTIVAPHGVRGDLRIAPETDFPERFLEMESCYIDGKEYHFTSSRFHKHFILATFAEITDRDQAALLSRKEVQVHQNDLVELPEGRFYIFDIIGLDVYDTQGNSLGIIKDVLQPGANDVYVVAKDGEPDLLLAAIESVVLEINLEEHKVIVNPPEWI